jgi:hypothetical protein
VRRRACAVGALYLEERDFSERVTAGTASPGYFDDGAKYLHRTVLLLKKVEDEGGAPTTRAQLVDGVEDAQGDVDHRERTGTVTLALSDDGSLPPRTGCRPICSTRPLPRGPPPSHFPYDDDQDGAREAK